jgi:hypothetical protein
MVATPYQPRWPGPVAGAGQGLDHTSVVLAGPSEGVLKVIRQPGYGLELLRTNVARPRRTVALEVVDDDTSEPETNTEPAAAPEQVAGSRLAVITRELSAVTRFPF